MQITVYNKREKLYIILRGELDEHTAAPLRRKADALIEDYPQTECAVFNLSGVSFLDSTAIGFLLGRYKNYKKYGIQTYITEPTPSADKILLMSGIYTLMPKI